MLMSLFHYTKNTMYKSWLNSAQTMFLNICQNCAPFKKIHIPLYYLPTFT